MSYSRSSKNFVLALATRLRQDRVDAIIDEWDLSPGIDNSVFMESMVLDRSIKKVLVMCDPDYQRKANTYSCVGDTQIITREIYEDAHEDKFIPVLCRRDSAGRACLPSFMQNLMYVELTDALNYEVGYSDILERIFD